MEIENNSVITGKKNGLLLGKKYIFQIQPQDVDFQFRITMQALVNILLITGQMNADDNGLGLRRLNKIECSWILLRMAIEMKRYPEQYEKIQVETWLPEVGRVTTTRNYCIRNEQNEIIGNVSSHWAMFDMQTRHIKDLNTLDTIHDLVNNRAGLIQEPMKLSAVHSEVIDSEKVKYSHIDINGHVNSTCYVQWICDCFPLSKYRGGQIKRFEINYMKELLFDDSIQIFQEEIETNDYRFEIRNGDKIACRARVVF